jgi:hypothetical protein
VLDFVEPASGIEPPTCGLRNLDNPISDNLSQPETTKQDALQVGTDRAGLGCPGSSAVAEGDERLPTGGGKQNRTTHEIGAA